MGRLSMADELTGATPAVNKAGGGLLFLILFLHAFTFGFDECYELFLHLPMGQIVRKPFLAPAASIWHRSTSPTHHRNAFSLMHDSIESPVINVELGSDDSVEPERVYTGDMGYFRALNVDLASKYRGDPGFHQSATGLTRSTSTSTVDEGSGRHDTLFESPSSAGACAYQSALPSHDGFTIHLPCGL
ncbi:uncharacterized protein BCR38DRAFT_10810 [Pseudomassariella vexata]|uniref:Uncharacterized protein n=1 Tax=Pseudomassariella vexata TaxID=1141098 RepID=A0A1Y2EJL5_9PEZI|nr:uncharacterized protein BCR38DRAFT_10810 [Pseudomassariella vexata]ORY71466.1 hypothetical protein BCR38DRAFT_10810 [Pseudomassariella vexata]